MDSPGSPADDTPRTYAELRRAVEGVFLRGQRAVDVAQVMVYWNTGDLIHRHVEFKGGRFDYGLEVVARLAVDFKASRAAMYRCLQFRRAYEIVSARRQLLWAHYRVLMMIEDRAQRDALEEAADAQGWTSPQLEQRARPLLLAQKQAAAPASARPYVGPALVPRRGSFGLHRLVTSSAGLAVDLGFTSYFDLLPEQAAGRQQGDFVRLDAAERVTSAPEGKAGELYTYRAECLRAVDGDTIWFHVQLRARHWLKEKVRLRGVDCRELDTAEGKAAKRFTAHLLASAESVTIATSKADKYDRYLVDVLIQPPDGAPEIFLNQALLETGHARPMDRYGPEDWTDDGKGVPA